MKLGTPVAKGNTAQIYHYDNKIIKVFNDNLPKTESHYEATIQKYAHSCGLSVPEVIDVTEIDGKQAIIMEFIKGRTIGDILSENLNQAEYYMTISIDIQQGIHSIVTDSLVPMSVKLRRQIKAAQQLDTRQKSVLLKKLDAMTHEKRLCHGDFHLFNLIKSDNDKVTIIDWVDASAGDPRADVYRTYLLYEQFSMELADMYLHLNCNKSGLSKDEIFQWAPIIAGARLSENVSSESNERLMRIVENYCTL
ncbi:aminoglycoside phosphotransferase [Virgibacillus indicus]|uniref:Aminoglycoside phosphotransferase n=1 Tax=Virgibacillus indicus TaxID=2024554 RepID=A0A265N5K1_9BACI|nr:aminoglycoside phosphotransferase family protein [Virgibacillus indicus]OZU87125.1 aminoglycoside phosphotransferase [Virgibacillus indicus]